ncbi:YlbF family regulator [Tepidibacillus decaturensis]|uniref:Uncharacterized protein n=1 Tax=Tepidibacillus decaturensis TaxID=1413211 RepID=A0A135L1E7_9BACI|nr:YlbF family regulator [Tepidibacillus decaturensis]KXG42812.1 hypothetical protein U473_01260 [Tepidibacillus decaturensis]
MSYPYDKAYELARVIEENENYKTVKELTIKVMSNPEQMKLIEEFRRKQFGMQEKQLKGLPIEQHELEETNQLYKNLSANPEIKKLLDAEERLSMLFVDINRILTEPLDKIYKKS